MYCPKCSQQQPSDEMRFCSRCGFPLAGVALLIENDGLIPRLGKGADQKTRSSRGKMIGESVYLTLIAWAVALVAAMAFNFGGPFEGIALVAALIFFLSGLIGLIRFLYAFLFVRETIPTIEQSKLQRSLESPALKQPARAALPLKQAVPVSDYRGRTTTKEIVPQPSVTENTTRLLEDQSRLHQD